jgi:4-hydroxybenzoyl-CoA thioesterase
MKTNTYEMTVQWGDCDPGNIVYYPNYFVWFENGTTELFASVGLELKTLFTDQGILGIPILDAHSKFIRPSRFRDVITVESGIESFGNSSFKVVHRILKNGNEAVTAHEIRAWVAVDDTHPSGIRALRIPDEVRAYFE